MTTMDDAITDLATFAKRYRTLRPWATDTEVRHAWQAARSEALAGTLSGDAEKLGQAMAELMAILRERASRDLGYLARACADAADYLDDWHKSGGHRHALIDPRDVGNPLATMDWWVFTFGAGHRLYTGPPCPTCAPGAHATRWSGIHGQGEWPCGLPLGRMYVRIPGRDQVRARETMVRIFGVRWSHQYDSTAEAGMDEHRLTELDVSLALAELQREGWTL